MRRAVLAAAVLLSVAACGGTSQDVPEGTALTIEVTLDEGAEPTTYSLTCEPAGGDHPQAEQACDVLDSAGADVFEAVSKDQVCTELYGGPQVATVKGNYDGLRVDATFNRTNGCEIDRWDELGTTFFDVPLL